MNVEKDYKNHHAKPRSIEIFGLPFLDKELKINVKSRRKCFMVFQIKINLLITSWHIVPWCKNFSIFSIPWLSIKNDEMNGEINSAHCALKLVDVCVNSCQIPHYLWKYFFGLQIISDLESKEWRLNYLNIRCILAKRC